jgi:hypothetical protein
MGFQNLVQARLRRDLKAQRQLGLPKQTLRISAHPWLKNDFAVHDFAE